MEIDVTKIPSLSNGLIQVDGSGNVSVDDSVYTGSGKIIYLISNGFAGTPVKGDRSKPYQTHSAALTAASDGDVIWIEGAHTTTTNFVKDGALITYYAPTTEDKLEFTDDFQLLANYTGTATGTGVVLIGEGYFGSTASEGAPCVAMEGGVKAETFIVRCGTFESNAGLILLGGTGGNVIFSPKTHRHTGTASAFYSGSSESGKVYIGGFELIITDQQVNKGINVLTVGSASGTHIFENINVFSEVTQVDADNYLMTPPASAIAETRVVSNVHSFVNDLKMFPDLATAPASPYQVRFSGDCSVLGLIGIVSALDSDFNFTGVGILKASDRTINLNAETRLLETETASFNSGTNKGNKEIDFNAASDGVCTIDEDFCGIGEYVVFNQISTGKLTFTSGTNVDPILNSGVLGTVAQNDTVAIKRKTDNGANQVYVII